MRWGCDVIFSKYISREWTHVCVSRAEQQSWCTGSVLAVCCVGGEGCDERWPSHGPWSVLAWRVESSQVCQSLSNQAPVIMATITVGIDTSRVYNR